MGAQHQTFCLFHGVLGQRNVHRHLVAVEVGVERRTNQGVDLDGAPLDKYGHEGLNTEAVQRRCTVEQDRAVVDHVLQDVPDLRLGPLNDALCAFDIVGQVEFNQAPHDKGLEDFQGHAFWQATLVQLQLRADYDDRAAGVVHPLAQQVLAEAALLAFSMSESDFNLWLPLPATARPRRPLSMSESTASWSMRFSLRIMISGRLVP